MSANLHLPTLPGGQDNTAWIELAPQTLANLGSVTPSSYTFSHSLGRVPSDVRFFVRALVNNLYGIEADMLFPLGYDTYYTCFIWLGKDTVYTSFRVPNAAVVRMPDGTDQLFPGTVNDYELVVQIKP